MPIYIQLLEYMKIYLISGVFKCGDKLPSVREFANTFKVTIVGDGGGSSSQSNMHDSPHSSKNKNKNLSRDLENILRNHYKKTTNFPVLIKRYLNCKTNKASIEAVHKRSFKNLKPGTDMASLTSAILKVKRKYT